MKVYSVIGKILIIKYIIALFYYILKPKLRSSLHKINNFIFYESLLYKYIVSSKKFSLYIMKIYNILFRKQK